MTLQRFNKTVARAALLFIALLGICGSGPAAASPADKPNIVLIMVDDLGYGDLASYGARDMQTPHLDGLMERGLRLDQFYANCTVCSPTRASLMTGLYPDKAGVPGVIRQDAAGSWGYLDPRATTLPQMLKTAGYHTALIGKWHLGLASPNLPNERGFDFFHGFLGDMMNDYYTHMRGGKNWMRRNGEVIKADGHATDVFSAWAEDYFNERAADKRTPFFLFLSYNAPHFPIQPPKDWLEKVQAREPELDRARAANVAFIEHLDANVGRVLGAIEQAGLADNTLIIFTSDNGGSIPHAQRNLPLRGGKQDHWEGGIRVPTCVVWPGRIDAGGRSDALGMTMDLFPTLCEIAGVEVPHAIDGQSLAPIWLGGGQGDPERVMIWVRREGGEKYGGRAYYAIRKGKWKLLQNQPDEPMQLVDLESDPHEKNPMAATGPVARELNALLMKHIQEAGRVPWQE